MHLSKVLLPKQRCGNPYAWHKLLWEIFPADSEAQRDFLFRIEGRSADGLLALLQSARAPAGAWVLASKPYAPDFAAKQTLRFRLAANPVKTIKDANGRKTPAGEVKSCRVPLIREDEQLDWLARKFEAAAEIVDATVLKRETLAFRPKGREGQLAVATFDGALQVRDPQALLMLVRNGIGHGKGFGCGLLSLAPAI
jgi:CRISPR system Cascade subunit CasE